MNEDCDDILVSKALWFSICSLFVVQVALTRPVLAGFGCMHVKSTLRAKKAEYIGWETVLEPLVDSAVRPHVWKKCSESALSARWCRFSIFFFFAPAPQTFWVRHCHRKMMIQICFTFAWFVCVHMQTKSCFWTPFLCPKSLIRLQTMTSAWKGES